MVKESGDKLIETGINTLQRTLLLKKEVEVEKVDVELERKRHEFRARMEACAQRQVEVQKKQQRVRCAFEQRIAFLPSETLPFFCLKNCSLLRLRHCFYAVGNIFTDRQTLGILKFICCRINLLSVAMAVGLT